MSPAAVLPTRTASAAPPFRWVREAKAPSSPVPIRRSLAREKRSAERAGRRGPWEGTCGVSRMCPDKAPSCYPSPTLGESSRESTRHDGVVEREARSVAEAKRGNVSRDAADRMARRQRCRPETRQPDRRRRWNTPSRAPSGSRQSCARSQRRTRPSGSSTSRGWCACSRARSSPSSSAATPSKRSRRACAGAGSRSRRRRSRATSSAPRARRRSGAKARRGRGAAASAEGAKARRRRAPPVRRHRSAARPRGGPPPEAALRSGKGAFLVKDKDSY